VARLVVIVSLLALSGDFTYRHGGIIRGDTSRREIALVFTGDEFGDGLGHVGTVLDSFQVKASFFFTGRFYRAPAFEKGIKRLRGQGHYLGAHSDQHLLYCAWEDRDSLLVTKEEFARDVQDNYLEMNRFGIKNEEVHYFLPAYEWYNEQIADWTRDLGLQLVNYTPGTRSHADYTTPDMGNRYVSSDTIVSSILLYEESQRYGLNGFILLTHVGTDPSRTDKFYHRLGSLLAALRDRGYQFVRIDELLSE